MVPLLLVVMRIGGASAAFFISLIMARSMDPAEMGIAMTYLSIAPIAAILVTGSTEAGCVRYIIGYLEHEEIDKARAMVRFNRQVALVSGAIVLVAVFVLQWDGIRRGEDFAITVAMIAMATVLLGWLRIGAAHAMALGKVIRSVAPTTFFRQMFLLLGLIVWIWAVGSPDAVAVVGMMLASVFIVLAIQCALNYRPLQRIGSTAIDASDRGDWIKVGMQLGLTLLFVQFSRDLTLVISAISLPPEDISVLAIATAIIALAKFFVVAVNQSITPELSRSLARDDMQAFMRKVVISNHMKFWPMILMFIVFFLFGHHIARLYGSAFDSVAPILLILMIEPLALAFFGPGGQYLSLSGHQHVLLPLSIITLLVLACAVTLGSRVGGLHGAAVGASATWLFWSASLAALTRRYAKRDVTLLSSFSRNVAAR